VAELRGLHLGGPLQPSLIVLAVCLPSADECLNLDLLLDEIDVAIGDLDNESAFVVVFDDGSTDGTIEMLHRQELRNTGLVVIRSRIRRGKSHALQQSLSAALELGASHLVTMDADGQDNPADLAKMVEGLNSGIDFVSGQRENRQDRALKVFASRAFNYLARAITGASLLDINSGFKAYSRSAAEVLLPFYYGDLHRVIVIIGLWLGLRVENATVSNRPRTSGRSKYGPFRGWRGIVDLITVDNLLRYQRRPAHFFNAVSLFLAILGLMAIAAALFLAEASESPSSGEFLLVVFGTGLIVSSLIAAGFAFLAELTVFGKRSAPQGSVTTWSAAKSGTPPDGPQGSEDVH